MALVHSLLTAIVRADGDALVMHVGEKPYVVTSSGPIELSSSGLNLEAMSGMVSQMLPEEALQTLGEIGAVEQALQAPEGVRDRFNVVVARGGDDIWIEIRRRRAPTPAPAAVVAAPPAPAPPPAPVPAAAAAEPVAVVTAPIEPEPVAREPEPVAVEPEPVAVEEVSVPESTPAAVASPPSHQGHRAAEVVAVQVKPSPIAETLPPAVAEAPAPEHRVEPASAPPEPASYGAAGPAAPAEPASYGAVAAPAVSETPEPPASDIEPKLVAAVAATPVSEPPPSIAPAADATVGAARISAPPEPPIAAVSSAAPAPPEPPVRPEPAVRHAVASTSAAPEPASARPETPASYGVASAEPARHAPAATYTEPQPVAAPTPVSEPSPSPVQASDASVGAPRVGSARPEPPASYEVTSAAAPPEPAFARSETPASYGAAGLAEPARPQPPARPEPPASYGVTTSVASEVHRAPRLADAPEPRAPFAPVVPLARHMRIDVPPRQTAGRPAGIERLLSIAAARGAAVLYLTSQSLPFVRVDGDIRVLDGEQPLASADVEAAVLELMPENAREAHSRGEPAEWVSEFEGVGRIRCTTFRDYRGAGALFHLISARPVSAEQLGLAREIQALATESDGLVLVASPRGGGKSTLIAAIVDLINRQHGGYVITLERQIRTVHDNRQSLVSQREVRGSAGDVVSIARAALRENPDVLVIEDHNAPEVIQLALDAAGSGLLVFLSVTAGSTTSAVMRLIDLFPPDRRRTVQAVLAERLRGAVAQVLLRKSGGGRVAAREVLLATSAVENLIAEGQFAQLAVAMDSGRKHGMVPLNDSLLGFVQSGAVDAREAYRRADDRAALLALLRRDGVDTSFAERLA